MKKIINDPVDFVDEVIESLLLAYPDQFRAVSQDNRALVRADARMDGRVGIVTGGGSGHMPLFLGYVGMGLCSGVAVGNVFSSPSPRQIYDATVACDNGAGVLYLYGNYGGDVYNFDAAAELAALRGISTTTVLGTDDILSAGADEWKNRRGVAGIFLAYKIAGAAAERGDNLMEVTRLAQKCVNRTRTMGVGLSPAILPSAGKPTFDIGVGEMEVGIGIHGEPGRLRGPLETADEITDRFLHELLGELSIGDGDGVAVLVNGLGATPLEELYLIYRRAHLVLADHGFRIHQKYIGEYATSLEMAGASLSILHLDEELAELLDAPARSPFFAQGAVGGSEGFKSVAPLGFQAFEPQDDDAGLPSESVRRTPAPGRLREIVLEVSKRLPVHAEELRSLDAALGDGDLGITVSTGAMEVYNSVFDLPADSHPVEIFKFAGMAFLNGNPSTFAALIGGGLISVAGALEHCDSFRSKELIDSIGAFQESIQNRGGAQVGDKTVVDVISSVREALQGMEGQDASLVAERAVAAARNAVSEGAQRMSRRGRASWVGPRSAGHRDPGSVAFLRLLEEIERSF